MKLLRLSSLTVLFTAIIIKSSSHAASKTETEAIKENHNSRNNYNFNDEGTMQDYVQYEDIDPESQSLYPTNDTTATSASQLIENVRQIGRNAIVKIGYRIWKYWSDVTHKTNVRRDNDIRFFLYTLQNPNTEQEIFVESSLSNNTNWDYAAKVKIIIHGYKESGMDKDKSSQNTKNAYMEAKMTDNIVVVDWQSLSKERNYFNAAKNIKIVAEVVADFILQLERQSYIQSFKDVHVIGFSLGAQTAGIVGYLIQKKSGGTKVSRITGLDPAGPGFDESVDEKDRIDKSDADFVDVIHCDQGSMVEGGHRGSELISGHADFYPNGGSLQPGCSSQSYLSKIFSSSCSHIYCPKLFQQSILGRIYIGCQCEDWNTFEAGFCECANNGPHMGEFCSTSALGQFYLWAEISDA